MEINFSQQPQYAQACVVLACFEDASVSSSLVLNDQHIEKLIAKSIAHSKFTGKRGQTLLIPCPENLQSTHFLIVGLGKEADVNTLALNEAGGAVYSALLSTKVEHANVHTADIAIKDFSASKIAAQIALGANLRSWKCNDFKTKLKPEHRPTLSTLSFITDAVEETIQVYEAYKHVAAGVFLTRELVTYPSNIIYPLSFAERMKEELEPLGVKVEILKKDTLHNLGMGALLGVGQGSAFDSCVVVMQWNGNSAQTQPLAFLGKGVTFDTGGISLKPAGGMEEMKFDMAGAGVVGGFMKSLALRKAKVNVVGVVGLVENMPSGTAQRPGDVVKSMSGQTIEVLNTDAEGRLVLADILWYTQDRFKPQFMINLATLTGAIIVALGQHHAGLFSNDDELSARLTASGLKVGEKLWRLPLSPDYDKDVDSPLADMQNIGGGRNAGSITAAQFLQRFVNDTKWAHLDIAGVTWTDKSTAVAEKGATAFGVRLLDHFVRKHYEQ